MGLESRQVVAGGVRDGVGPFWGVCVEGLAGRLVHIGRLRSRCAVGVWFSLVF